MLLSLLMKSLWLYLLHTQRHVYGHVHTHYSDPIASLRLFWQVWLPHRHIDKHSHTHTCTNQALQGIFPILGLHNGHFVHPPTSQPRPLPSTPHHHPLPTASSTSLFKWEIMQMSTHHCSTPHISDVHWGKSVVCLWESAHGCFYLLSNGRGLNTQSTSQVFEAIWWYFFYQSRAAMLFFTFSWII